MIQYIPLLDSHMNCTTGLAGNQKLRWHSHLKIIKCVLIRKCTMVSGLAVNTYQLVGEKLQL